MRLRETPNLLILKNLLGPVDTVATALSEIASAAEDPNVVDVVRQGLFILAVARVETVLSDTLKYYLSVIPQKISKESLSVTKDEFLAHRFDLIDFQIEKFLHSLFYKPIDDVLGYFCSTLSLEADPSALSAPLHEIKATRNVLLHNNLVSNSAYLEAAGESRRANKQGEKLEITQSYLKDSLDTLLSFVAEVDRLISSKYMDYTKLAAIRRLWDFTFKSQVMPFDDFWCVDEKADNISSRKKGKYEDGLSSSETIFLSVWRAHFSGYAPDLKPITMYTLDDDHQAKLLYLLSVFRHFWIQ
ncbi:hypothetical protein [uncultured Ilyobacter sp.]|uniref:hypothetical protein n=1 Tax=uncultured Ilyobacter sp. TaxID=544433 RepID=UPI0029F51371|nr:hypothetical protein [uncultured Ilyobacter sp.]